MKKHATTILLFVIMFVGLGLLLYPPLADYYNSFHQSRAIAAYSHSVEDEQGTDYAAYWAAANAYNETLAGKSAVSRLRAAETATDNYDSLLRMEQSDVLGVIEISEIAVTLPLYHGTSDMVLQVAVGHLRGTSLPTGEPGTHTAFSAHRGLPSAKLFTNLDQLQLGDIFILRVLDEIFTYEVDRISIVLPHQVEALDFVDDSNAYCSLITCTPYGVNSHRLIVRGHRVENSTAALAARVTADAKQIDPIIVTPIVAAPMLVVLLIIMLVSTSPKRRKSARKHLSAEEIVRLAGDVPPKNEQGGERP
ncbi:MAG: class C sortase [Clostridia bacterium]|nr:class C sortase [Clostridia bacterium]